MPQEGQTETGDHEVVLGVDTHKDVHVAVVLTTLGVLLAGRDFPTTKSGYRDMVMWARSYGPLRLAGVEGTGSYGAGLTRLLRAAGVHVIEVNRPDRSVRRRRGKSDAVDAEAAARAVLAGDATALPKTADGLVEAMRIFKTAKDSAVKARVQAINQLKAIVVTAEPALREALALLNTSRLVARCCQLDVDAQDAVTAASLYTLRQLARRIQHLETEIRDLQHRIAGAVQSTAPELLRISGVGPDTAATLLIAAGDNPGRLASEASFAALCGVSPVEASSGKTQRRRLNRGGHRQANAALYRAVLIGLRWNPRTRDYMQRRTAEGLSKREIIRCLKRYLARAIYRIIIASMTPTTPPQPSTA
ncbi:IS110 family transposase [Plantactinospora sp. KBS50]|uniref:IS110 family transposase n=1 Tax=Plantactinospora sp. KBS50 TaxID=2024580 RepID=UPI000BAABA6B|nr:IS110 family transposase [Plantactinospora sp. KBS50]ASW57397.1 IS110 family transposase [Plantactinospora sp. KBS50]ASW57506.1 IS110 family transposase [Plantactinospora sp. KBS50]ASW57534.1 IS110 family transposase [Plantactinospora sp. KBS50]ASW57819.1 IS110 family transposase [Plantactinospora sp. KBS50]